MTMRTPLLGVSACLWRGDAVLLVRRSRPPFADRLSLPGGRVEFGETLAAAVAREVLEETSLTAFDLRFRRFHEAIDPDGNFHAVIAVFSGVLPADCAPMAGDDAAEIFFHDIGSVAALDALGQTTPGLAAIVAGLARSAVAENPHPSGDPATRSATPC